MRGRGLIAVSGLSVALAACGIAGGDDTASDPGVAAATTIADSAAGVQAEGEAPPEGDGGAADQAGAGAAGQGVGGASGGRSFVVSASGDILPHSPLWGQAAGFAGGNGYDFGPMFAKVAPAIDAADLAICHLETPIAPEGEDLSTDPLYGVPRQIADAIAGAGFDRCSLASNHTFDRGPAGIDRTVEVLESVGVAQSGMARTEPEAAPAPFEVNGITVGHLSYSYGFNGNWIPPDEPWRAEWMEPDRIIFDAIRAREQGAEVVIVSLHWGTEGESEPNAEQRSVAETITASGEIDLVIGHHAHVLQPIEQVNGVWVAFGLGNILSNHPVAAQWPPSSQDAALAEFTITLIGGEGGTDPVVEVGRPVVRATWVDKQNGFVIRDVSADLADPAIGGGARQAREASLERTAAVLGDYLAIADTP
ncbi:MAG: CapA family protein [Ilumatobacteraceae bacterium]